MWPSETEYLHCIWAMLSVFLFFRFIFKKRNSNGRLQYHALSNEITFQSVELMASEIQTENKGNIKKKEDWWVNYWWNFDKGWLFRIYLVMRGCSWTWKQRNTWIRHIKRAKSAHSWTIYFKLVKNYGPHPVSTVDGGTWYPL